MTITGELNIPSKLLAYKDRNIANTYYRSMGEERTDMQ
jgi:hypothetical protein